MTWRLGDDGAWRLDLAPGYWYVLRRAAAGPDPYWWLRGYNLVYATRDDSGDVVPWDWVTVTVTRAARDQAVKDIEDAEAKIAVARQVLQMLPS